MTPDKPNSDSTEKIPYDCQDILLLAQMSSNGSREDREAVYEILQLLATNGVPKDR